MTAHDLSAEVSLYSQFSTCGYDDVENYAYEHRDDELVFPCCGSNQHRQFCRWGLVDTRPRLAQMTATARYYGAELDDIAALVAKEAVVNGDQSFVQDFTTSVLRLQPTWHDAVSTALLGDWANPLHEEDAFWPPAMVVLKREIRVARKQLMPLWNHRTGGTRRNGRRTEGRRVAMLETPGIAGITLRDVLSESTCPEDELLALVPADPRLARLLGQLLPQECAVVLALGLPGIETWEEAAEYVEADDPPGCGERVRRKVRRLTAEQRRRDAQRSDTESRLWLPERDGKLA
jgi:hypothetical protein